MTRTYCKSRPTIFSFFFVSHEVNLPTNKKNYICDDFTKPKINLK